MVSTNKPIDVASATTSVLREFKNSYLVCIEIDDNGGTKRIHFPSIGKSKLYRNHLSSSTLTTSFDGETVKYTLYRAGHVRFWNQWTNPKFNQFERNLIETLHAR